MTKKPPFTPPGDFPQILEMAIDDYHRWADGYFRGVESRNTITAPLYHYTGLAGLEGILKSDSIWFTDYRHLNDPNELLHGLALAQRMLERRAQAGGFEGMLFAWVNDLLNQKNFGRALEFLIASFSRNSDELGQWRAYADNAQGVAIGFSPTLFLAVEAANKDPRRNVFVGSVLYDDAKTRQRHSKGLDAAGKIARDARKYAYRHLRHKDIGMEFLNRLSRSVIASPLIWNALTCKHSGYRGEDEVRLVMLGAKRKFRGKTLKRTRGTKIVPYVPYKLELGKPGSVVEIVVGPAAPKSAEADVKALLNTYGIKARVRRSRIPYRNV
jgi:hypothetical protein